jgi:Nif-specific regulatory protein
VDDFFSAEDVDRLLADSTGILESLRRELRGLTGLIDTGAADLAPGQLRDRAGRIEGDVRRLEVLLEERTQTLRGEVERLAERLSGMAKEKQKFAMLLEISRALSSVTDVDDLLGLILDQANRVTSAERGFLVLVGEGGELDFRAARSSGREDIPDAEREISRSIISQVARTGEALVIPNALSEPGWSEKRSVRELRILSVICVPLRTKGRVTGVVYLESRSVKGLFHETDLELLVAFSVQASIALENANLYGEVRRSRERLSEENFRLKSELRKRFSYGGIIGGGSAMQTVYALIDKVVPSKVNVLVRGESGTGKELIAKIIHYNGPRAQKPFVRVNCAAIPETLLESELFGIEGGTATGVTARPGKFEIADGGTMFLDEIGDMSLVTQAKVLRAIQEKEFERVGGRQPIRVDVRLIAATNIALEKAIEERRFREDLYYRLNVVTILLPPLRERMDDVLSLVRHFLEKHCKEHGIEAKQFSAEAMDLLLSYEWPGNVRELENVVERAVILSSGPIIPCSDLPEPVRGNRAGPPLVPLTWDRPLDDVVGAFEQRCIIAALEECAWVQTKAAEKLGMTERNLRYKMRKYGMSRQRSA